MLLFSAHIHVTHTNALFPADSFLMPPNFAVPRISGWHLSFPHGLAGRHFPGEGACKSHPPFNLHTFRPCQPPPVSPILAALHSLTAGFGGCFRQIAPNRAERVPGGLFIHFFQTRAQIATRTATGGNKAFLLPIRIHQFHSGKGLDRHCRIYRNRKKRLSFDKTPCPCFSHCQLCGLIASKPQYAAQSLLVIC